MIDRRRSRISDRSGNRYQRPATIVARRSPPGRDKREAVHSADDDGARHALNSALCGHIHPRRERRRPRGTSVGVSPFDQHSSHWSGACGGTGDTVHPGGRQDSPRRRQRAELSPPWESRALGVGRCRHRCPELHFHDLRHTGNTLASQTGASTRDLMTRMGHDSPARGPALPARDCRGRSRHRRRPQRSAQDTHGGRQAAQRRTDHPIAEGR